MSDPLRLRIMKALTTMLESIELDGGDTLTGKVFRGREMYGDNDPLPMISIIEPPLSIERISAQPDNTNGVGNWDILIQGWTEIDPTSPNNSTDPAYVLVAKVVQIIALEKQRGGKSQRGPRGADYLGQALRVQNIAIGAPVVRPPDFTSEQSQFYLLLTLSLVEDVLNPFA